ncbi:MAG TPA: HAD-IA family hydrolase [Gemmata sp.]|nr:HAD-IA family hydrolase [Gemmata sp.]
MPTVIPPGTRAVFFDAVGTLLFPDPPAPVVYSESARRAGLDIPPDEVRSRWLRAFRAEEAADRLAGWVTSEARELARWRRIVAESVRGVADPDVCFRELFDHFSRPSAWRVDPDAGDVLTALRDRGLVVGLASNYDARLLTVLAGFRELELLRDRVVVSATVGHRKPAAAFFTHVVQAAGCERTDVLYVGDDIENDHRGATAAGLNAILIDPDGRFSEAGRSIKELRELLT